MLKKSVCLFSVSLLSITLCPLSVFADEVPENPAPVVTAELIESAAPAEPTLPEAVETPVVQAPEAPMPLTDETKATETPVEEPVQSVNEETPVVKEAESTNVAAPVVEKSESTNAAAPVVQARGIGVTSTTPTLTDDHDGKITDHKQAITDENAKISSDYNFMPNFDGLTDEDYVVNAGTASYTENSYSFNFDLSTANPNEITVTFKNIGSYKGTAIDMKITVKNWSPLAGSYYTTPSLSIHKSNGITMRGIKDVKLGYSFLDNLTGHAATVSGFFNFTDIDLKQSIDLFNNNNIQNFYVARGNVLYYKAHNDFIRIGDITDNNSFKETIENWLTYTYKNISSFDIRYNQDYETGAVFNYTYQAPVIIEEAQPEPVEEPQPKEPDTVTPLDNTPVKESQPKKEPVTTLAASPKPAAATTVEKVEEATIVKAAAIPTSQPSLPQTNEQASILTVLGSLCLLLFSAFFLNKKKTS